MGHDGMGIGRRNAATIDAGMTTNGANTTGANKSAPRGTIMITIATRRTTTSTGMDTTSPAGEFGLDGTDRKFAKLRASFVV